MSALNGIRSVAKRELVATFTSPVAYVFLVIFLLLAGFFTFSMGGFFERGEASLAQPFFSWHPWLYLFLVPALGMRLWAEENRLGTIELLLTLPIAPWQAIIGKFLASLAVLALALLLTLPLVITVYYLGDPDGGATFSAYLGSLLLAGAYLAVTCATSAASRNQVVSFILSVVACLFLILCGFPPFTRAVQDFAPRAAWLVDAVAALSVMPHFETFQRGLVTFGGIIYFLSVMAVCLFLTSVILRNHRR